jgi:hypothetical protein
MRLAGKIGSPGLVTIMVILGSVAVMARYDRVEWSLIVLSLVGLSIFLFFEMIVHRTRYNHRTKIRLTDGPNRNDEVGD